jgi:putative spermidine/putrescine transport system substrate-binding protein
MTKLNRRDILAGAGALGLAGAAAGRRPRLRQRHRRHLSRHLGGGLSRVVAPALKKNAGVDIAFDSLFAVDQVAKVRAARGVPPFDCFVLDPGPAAAAQAAGLFEPIDASKLTNAAKVPAGLIKSHGVTCNAQVVGIAYNPKKFPTPPKAWTDLFKPRPSSSGWASPASRPPSARFRSSRCARPSAAPRPTWSRSSPS